jgi:dihydroneopterin aldolase/2-amino-4-hydroxy-6-hydroxymethyldihydropteridine diphosphokinase
VAEPGRSKSLAYIGLGSNVEPEENVVRAIELLSRETELVSVSRFYRSAALRRPEQPEFLNGACCICTNLSARALKFDVLRGIERRLGRVRSADKYAPRSIDLDVLLYGDEVCDEEDLRIPDPDIRERAFVALPLLELWPEAVLPDTGQRLADLPVVRQATGLRVDQGFTELLHARFMNEREAR